MINYEGTIMKKRTMKLLLVIFIILLIVHLSFICYLYWIKPKIESADQKKNNNQTVGNSADSNSHIEKERKSDPLKMSSVEVTPDETALQKDAAIDQIKVDELEKKEIKVPHMHWKNSESTFGKKVVFIYFSHNRESFLPYFKERTPSEEAYHSKVNITLVGEYLGKSLRRNGIGNIVSNSDIIKMLNERNLDFGYSYQMSRQFVLNEKQVNHDLEMSLDIHRDSIPRNLSTTTISGIPYAKISFIIGSAHKNYKENLKFAHSIHRLIEKDYKGLSKGIIIKDKTQGNGVYNQDLSPHNVIIEIGGVENNLEELYRTAEILGIVISEYYFNVIF